LLKMSENHCEPSWKIHFGNTSYCRNPFHCKVRKHVFSSFFFLRKEESHSRTRQTVETNKSEEHRTEQAKYWTHNRRSEG
jgi:hypothetical protein